MPTLHTTAMIAGLLCSLPASAAGSLFGADPVASCLRPAAMGFPISACVAPGTDPEYMSEFYNWMLAQTAGPDFLTNTRWNFTLTSGGTVLGDPTTITYSFPTDALAGISGGATNQNVLNAKMVQWFGSIAAGKTVFRTSFDRWEQLSGFRYVETVDDNAPWNTGGSLGVRGEIRIVAINIDGGSNVLAFTFFPTNGDMVFDSSENYGSGAPNYLFFRNVHRHEAGHGFGLNHVCPANSTKLMEPFISLAYDGPRHDDVRGIQYFYGDTLENNDSSAVAANLGVLAGFPFTLTNVSINRSFDDDWYKFTTGPGSAQGLDFFMNPVGFTYDAAAQNGASCPAGNTQNSLIVQNIALEVYAPDAVTLLGSSTAGGFGAGETVTGITVQPNTTYFVRLYSQGVTGLDQTQLYQLQINTSALPPCPGDTNGDRIVNFADLNIVLGQFGQSGSGLAGDVNGDGFVNFADLNIVLSNFGLVC